MMITLWKFETSETGYHFLYQRTQSPSLGLGGAVSRKSQEQKSVHILQTFGQPERNTHFDEPLVTHIHSQEKTLSSKKLQELTRMMAETRAMIGAKNLFPVLFLPENEVENDVIPSEGSGISAVSYEEAVQCLQPIDTGKMAKKFGSRIFSDTSEENLRHKLAEQMIIQRLAEEVSSRWVANVNINTSAQDTVPDHWKAKDFYSNPLALMVSQIDDDTKEVCIASHSALSTEAKRNADNYFTSPEYPFFQNERVEEHSIIPLEIYENTWNVVDEEKPLGISSFEEFLSSFSQHQLLNDDSKNGLWERAFSRFSRKKQKKQKKIHLHYQEPESSLSEEERKKIQRMMASTTAPQEKGMMQDIMERMRGSFDTFLKTNDLLSRAGLRVGILPSLSNLLDKEYIVPNEKELGTIIKRIREEISTNRDASLFQENSDTMSIALSETLCPRMDDPRFNPYNHGNEIRESFQEWTKKRDAAVFAKTHDPAQEGHRPPQGKGVDVPNALERAYTSGVLNIGDGISMPRVALNLSEGMEPEVRERREKIKEHLKTANVIAFMPYVQESTAGNVAEYAAEMLGNRKDRVYSIDNNRGIDEEIQKKIGENSNIVDRNAVLNTLNWDRIEKDFNIPSDSIVDAKNIINGQPKISGLKGIALYSALIELAQNPDINDDTMIMFVDSDYENTDEYNPLLYLGNALLHAEENNFQLNGVNMAKAGAGRNNVLTHGEYSDFINDAIEEKNERKFAIGVNGASSTWPHSDAFCIRWGVLKNMPIAQDMDFEHVAKTFLHINDAFDEVRRFWQVANDNPKKECGVSSEMREWMMMKGLANHLESLLKILEKHSEKHNYDYTSEAFLRDFNKLVAGVCVLETYIPDGISGAVAEVISCSQGYLLPSVETLFSGGYFKKPTNQEQEELRTEEVAV